MEYDASKIGQKRFSRSLRPHSSDQSQQKVCYQWKLGRCYRLPCPFLHPDIPSRRTHVDDPRSLQSSASAPSKWGRGQDEGMASAKRRSTEKICKFWILGKCSYGDGCRYLHSWCIGESFTFLAALDGHQKGVSGITLPSGSDKLYSASQDESVRIWDCQTGQCAAVVNLGGEVGCMISQGPWIFVGLMNVVKAFNTQTNSETSLGGPVGQVHSLEASGELLFAGVEDGSILVWKFNNVGNSFEPAASLLGHSLTVVSLVVGAKRLYSGSMDNTIRVWDLGTLQCLQTLMGHTSVVMSVLCWDQFLLSCSLDQTIKVWAATESGNLEVAYTHNEEHGVLALCGTHDLQAKPVLMCACEDNAVRFYDLPSFNERGKVLSKDVMRAIHSGPDGLFFTGDQSGGLKVWKWRST